MFNKTKLLSKLCPWLLPCVAYIFRVVKKHIFHQITYIFQTKNEFLCRRRFSLPTDNSTCRTVRGDARQVCEKRCTITKQKKFYRVNCGKLIFILGKPILMRMETFCLSATLLLKFFFKPYSRFFSPSIQGGSVFLSRDPHQITNPHTPSPPHPHTHLLTPPTPACALPERPGGSPCVRPPLTSWGQHLRKRANRQIWESSKQTDLGNEQTGRFGKRTNR